jgi:hypothetical protein
MALLRNRFIDFLLIPAIVVLVGVAAFGLGRLSVLKETSHSLVIHPVPENPATSTNGNRNETN